MIHPIYTAGYSGHTPEELHIATYSLDAIVLDIRFKPFSRVPGWSGNELSRLLGTRYIHVKELGNPGAFDDGPMRLHDEKVGIRTLAQNAKQRPLILLCGCAHFHSCHRSLVSQRLAAYDVQTQELVWPLAPPQEGWIMCISLWQPWATLMALGLKRIETRDWEIDYRGALAIHAAKRWTGEQVEFLEDEPLIAEPLREAGYNWGRKPKLHTDLPLGAVVSVLNVTGCKRTEDLRPLISREELAYGNYGPKRFGWTTDSVRALAEPIPFRGAQKLFKVPFPDELRTNE